MASGVIGHDSLALSAGIIAQQEELVKRFDDRKLFSCCILRFCVFYILNMQFLDRIIANLTLDIKSQRCYDSPNFIGQSDAEAE